MNNIRGWMSEKQLEWLNSKAKEMNSIAEVGSYAGRSTYALLEGCKGTVTAIDDWSGEGSGNNISRDEFMNNVGHFNNLRVLTMDSVDAANTGDEYDMVFIDANHTYDAVTRDIKAWLPRVKRLICGHDYDLQSVRNAVKDTLGEVSETEDIWYKEITFLKHVFVV